MSIDDLQCEMPRGWGGGVRWLKRAEGQQPAVNTLTHVLVNAAIDRRVRTARAPSPSPVASKPFVVGALAPDVPLVLLTAGAAVWFPARHGWTAGETFGHVFRVLYFHDPWWIAATQALHAPLVLGAGIGLAWMLRRRHASAARWLGWFCAGALVHSALDIAVHHDDGPLLLFPFDWQYRFASPVSYWDPAHYAHIVRPLELALALVLAVYVLGPPLRDRLRRGREG